MTPGTIRFFLLFIIICLGTGCANIVPPTGGQKDTVPPKLVSVTPVDSQLNKRVTRIEMNFDEFLELKDVAKEVQVAPLLPVPLTVTLAGREVTVEIPDSLLNDNTTYRISMGNAIRDLHESNPFTGYTYTFSTGSFFDSLQLSGTVINASTGLPDSGSVVMLYNGDESDSVVVRKKPLYVTKVQPGGLFSFKGLPDREFQIFALKDKNENLTFDGGEEAIAFLDSLVIPADSVTDPVMLKLFVETTPDTLKTDSVKADSLQQGGLRKGIGSGRTNRSTASSEGFNYSVGVDTSILKRRSFDVTKPLRITFSKRVDTFNAGRINLAYDSSDISIEAPFHIIRDTASDDVLQITTAWKEDRIYTLRLLKGFAKDSAGTDAMPSRHSFRTKSDDDYSKLHIHLPAQYDSTLYVLMVTTDRDTIYQKPVTYTIIHFNRLQPGDYKMRIIVDRNGNGKWDTGDLFKKIQPEEVIPYNLPIQLKAGWDNTVDFVQENKKKDASSPGKRDKP